MQKSAVIFLYDLSASGRRLLTSMRNSRCRSVHLDARLNLKNRQDCQFSQAPLARMINLNA